MIRAGQGGSQGYGRDEDGAVKLLKNTNLYKMI
jgi:hypothetical protein